MATPSVLPDPETIRRTAVEVTRRPDYRLEALTQDHLLAMRLMYRLREFLLTIFRWLYKLVEGLPEWLQHVIVWGLVLILVVLLGHMVYSIVSLFWASKRAQPLTVELSTAVSDPLTFERQAEEAAAKGDCSLAVRLLFRACVLRLEQAETRKFRGGMTNREILRRHRNSAVYESIRLFVETLEFKWYGQGVCSPADYEACRLAHAALVRSAKGARDVHGA